MAETSNLMNFEAAAYTAQGTPRERVALPGAVFDGTVNVPVMHQAVKAFLANQRQANASTKTRGLVIGGNAKPWKQKGTGRARQGSTRAPHWVGGGTVFGPSSNRNYHETVPRQVRALARKSALNARARENAILVVDRIEFDAPQTSRMAGFIASLGLVGQKVLLLTDSVKPNVFLSARNLSTVHVMPYSDVSTYHVLWSDVVVIESGALGEALEPIAESERAAAPAKKKPAATKAVAKQAATKSAAKSETKTRTAKKPAAKKAAAKKSTATKSTATKSTATKSTAKKSATTRTSSAKSAAKPTKRGE